MTTVTLTVVHPFLFSCVCGEIHKVYQINMQIEPINQAEYIRQLVKEGIYIPTACGRHLEFSNGKCFCICFEDNE